MCNVIEYSFVNNLPPNVLPLPEEEQYVVEYRGHNYRVIATETPSLTCMEVVYRCLVVASALLTGGLLLLLSSVREMLAQLCAGHRRIEYLQFPVDIAPGMVNLLEEMGGCIESMPCQHSIKLVLADGRENTIHLSEDDVALLLEAIPQQNIRISSRAEHFSRTNQTAARTAQEILNTAFRTVS